MNKKFLLPLFATFMMVLGVSAQNNSYNMVLEMTNGTKITTGPNDVQNISFTDGQLTISGTSIEELKNDIKAIKEKLEELTTAISNNNSTSLGYKAEDFVGYWNMSVAGNSHPFVFLPNGKAWKVYNQWSGEWTYNEKTNVLATSIEMWSFDITAVFGNHWTGTTINTGKAVSATKGDDASLIEEYLKMLIWKQEDGTTSKISNGFYDYYLNSEYYYSGILNLILDVENGNASFEVEYEYELTHYTTIENKRYKKKDSYEIKGMYRDQPTLIINSGTLYYGTWR